MVEGDLWLYTRNAVTVPNACQTMDFILFREPFHDIHCPSRCRGYLNRRVGAVSMWSSFGCLEKIRGLVLTWWRKFGAREWGRTITALRPPDFESGASASSATRASFVTILHQSVPQFAEPYFLKAACICDARQRKDGQRLPCSPILKVPPSPCG
jgi:hypothetical protein